MKASVFALSVVVASAFSISALAEDLPTVSVPLDVTFIKDENTKFERKVEAKGVPATSLDSITVGKGYNTHYRVVLGTNLKSPMSIEGPEGTKVKLDTGKLEIDLGSDQYQGPEQAKLLTSILKQNPKLNLTTTKRFCMGSQVLIVNGSVEFDCVATKDEVFVWDDKTRTSVELGKYLDQMESKVMKDCRAHLSDSFPSSGACGLATDWAFTHLGFNVSSSIGEGCTGGPTVADGCIDGYFKRLKNHASSPSAQQSEAAEKAAEATREAIQRATDQVAGAK